MSEQSELLMNELVAACIAFGREREPDWQSRIGKAQHDLKAHIAELEEQARNLNLENEQLRRGVIDKTKPEKFDENIVAMTKAMSERFKDEDPEEFFRNLRDGA